VNTILVSAFLKSFDFDGKEGVIYMIKNKNI
jgi:hypothetical protein